MAADTDFSFSYVYTYDGASFTDITNEMRSPAGTSSAALESTDDYLYLGHDEKFDLAVFDIDTAGALGALTWEYYNGSTWVEFVPGSGRFRIDPDYSFGLQFAFDKDGAELFPPNLLKTWTTTTVNSSSAYWVRVSTASVTTAPTLRRIQMRPLAAYCSTKDVFELLQLGAVLGGTDFTTSTYPTKDTVETFIQEAQSYIDYLTRKSWRPNYVVDEKHDFLINGFKLDKADSYKVLDLSIWNGAEWQSKTQGRTGDFFLLADTGMIHFSRYFLLPARFQSYSGPAWRWGAGEFTFPVSVTYLYGRDLYADVRESGIVRDAAKKLACIDIVRSADFGESVVSGMDRIQLIQRLQGWKEEIDDRLESLRAFETF